MRYGWRMPINRADARTLSSQIAAEMRRRITEGEYTPGQRFPSLKALAAEYNVAELTVHAAVRELQQQGVLASVSGRGTFVQRTPAPEEEPDGPLPNQVAALRAEVDALRERLALLEQQHDASS